jgi:hypothetical protein
MADFFGREFVVLRLRGFSAAEDSEVAEDVGSCSVMDAPRKTLISCGVEQNARGPVTKPHPEKIR